MTEVVTNIMGEVEALVQSYEAQRKALLDKLRPQFQSIYAPFFAVAPKGAVIFTAYTPYFNDGDECVFSVHERAALFDIGEDDVTDYDSYDGDVADYSDAIAFKKSGETVSSHSYYKTAEEYKASYSYKEVANKSIEELEALTEASKVFDQCDSVFERIPEDMIKDLFGDHVKVHITADGVTVEEYDHD